LSSLEQREQLIPRSDVGWETPLRVLLDDITPNHSFFVRHHALAVPAIARDEYRLTIAGSGDEVKLDLKAIAELPRCRETITLECAGNGRSAFDPRPRGLPWDFGAISTAVWEGVRLSDVLGLVAIPPNASHAVFDAYDGRVEPDLPPYKRSLPLARALEDGVLIADTMNGEPLPVEHGGPLRLLVGGWTANHSVKWLRTIAFADREDGGFWMAEEYRVPGADDTTRVIETPAPIAIIAAPLDGSRCDGKCEVRGIAYGSPCPEQVRVDVAGSVTKDVPTSLRLGRFAWASWSTTLELPPGPHRLSARAIGADGEAAPSRAAHNERGYCYFGPHSIRINVS
jgi:DMSO/TMAO reductase YedYZ molybdopterin-dependent catalytic subunit